MPFIGSIIVKPYVASEDIYCVDIQNYAKKISYCVREPKISFMYLQAHCYRLAIFFEFNSKKFTDSLFLKNYRDLKSEYFFKYAETFLLHQRTIVNKKILNYNLFNIFFIFKNGENGF